MDSNFAAIALVHFLFGIFCAYWAQNSSRNPTLWFFLGFFFAPITGLVLLSEDRKDGAGQGGQSAPQGR